MSAPRLLSNRYELGDTLGYGGMSEVHHGHDVRLGREVAVKILRADLARDPQFQERFRREAQNAAALNHPAIVAVYDTGEADSEYGPLPYIVMEYVEGRTLRDIVKTEGPMSQKRAMEVMADVCAALDFSHRHGIVHRDVKPANVMITRNGAVKVMDFGIARALHDGQAAMTQTAAVIGTAQYLSPEQARGEQVDARSDVYAAGCVLYELVTAEPPFTGDSPVAVAYQHVREAPQPPSASNPAVSAELDAVVLKALAKGTANRYQSASEMRSDLVRTLSGQRPAAPLVMSDGDHTEVLGGAGQQAEPYDEPDVDGHEEDARNRRRKRALLTTLLGVLGIGLIAFVAWIAGAFDGQASLATVPDVRGKTVEQAKSQLRSAGFSNFEEEKIVCRNLPDGEQTCSPDKIGKVIQTDPQATEQVPTESQITIQVGAEPEQVSVPDLQGMDPDEAEQTLHEHDLMLDPNFEETEVDNEDALGTVVKQSPESGAQLEQGGTVRITIGVEPEQVKVTDYTGKPYEEAKQGLEADGLNVNREEVDSDKPAGIVVNQRPNGGMVTKGSTVVLKVSNGSEEKIDMPDLIGMTEDQALATLRDKGWDGSVQIERPTDEDSGQEGIVVETSPSAGSPITKNQSLTLRIGKDEDGSTDPAQAPPGPPWPGFPGRN